MINSSLDKYYSKKITPHHIATCHLTPKQYVKIKSFIVNTNNHLNGIFQLLTVWIKNFFLVFVLKTLFLIVFFYLADCKDTNATITHQNKLENIFESLSNNQYTVLSVKNRVTTSVLHIWKEYKIIVKTVHHIINVLSTEAELFAIRCNISWAFQMQRCLSYCCHHKHYSCYQTYPQHIYPFLSTTIHCHISQFKEVPNPNPNPSLTRMIATLFHSRTALVMINSLHIYWLIRSQNSIR